MESEVLEYCLAALMIGVSSQLDYKLGGSASGQLIGEFRTPRNTVTHLFGAHYSHLMSRFESTLAF